MWCGTVIDRGDIGAYACSFAAVKLSYAMHCSGFPLEKCTDSGFPLNKRSCDDAADIRSRSLRKLQRFSAASAAFLHDALQRISA